MSLFGEGSWGVIWFLLGPCCRTPSRLASGSAIGFSSCRAYGLLLNFRLGDNNHSAFVPQFRPEIAEQLRRKHKHAGDGTLDEPRLLCKQLQQVDWNLDLSSAVPGRQGLWV